MFKKLLPWQLRKYFEMPKRIRKHELQSTLWYMPGLYILGSFIFVAITLYVDTVFELSNYVPEMLRTSAQPTRLLISALIGGILTLSAFTLNSLLVVLTTFSGQFSPRMLMNFVADRTTQHFIGIFHFSFVYVLVIFLFITSEENEYFVAIPGMTVFLAFVTVITFIFFMNHATSWMQVHNIATHMKEESISIVRKTLRNDLEQFRCEEPNDLMEKEQNNETLITAHKSGYIQLIDFKAMIDQAEKDQVIVGLHSKVGDYVLKDNRFFSYWGPGSERVNPEKYVAYIEVGYKETEIQDIKMGMTKLSEIGVKSLGNNDPQTTITVIHQMADLLLEVERDITFTPYLADQNKQVRVIMDAEDFGYYLYRGFGYLRHYAGDNYPIITEIIIALSMVAQSISKDKLDIVWDFAKNSMDHIPKQFIYNLDRDYLLQKLYNLAVFTNHQEDYYPIEKRLLTIEDHHS
ncbi:DUF2254 domain-containing protein [Pseudalkalibacillus hwajinpoensis]|uniref:DUF2254 domain-containing protein n=1 Tax=Guptibacillus hwajinpoensis TaxID=208199 RepID=A0A4U1MNB4_9BACL|nr:DUF2254 domain-containing protein [Pseudalkalibacillus hwajinpoensis]TKD72102.1 DUF2254 domain-containing protein [Pseudalkalibacillus hwajinpoensis]